MDRIRKEVSLTEEETNIDIKSPSKDTSIEPEKETKKEEIKPKRERKKKKEVKKIERPKLNTYTISGYVKNSQGRFKFTDIVEAQDEIIASDIYKQRVKKEFSAVRAINKLEIKEFKDGDIRKTEEIIEELKPANTNMIKPCSDEDLALLVLDTVLNVNNTKIYAVSYAPSKKKSVIKRFPKLYYIAENEQEAKESLKEEVMIQLGEYNEKWIQSISAIEDNFSKEVQDTGVYSKVLSKIKKLKPESKETLKDFYDKLEQADLETISEEEQESLNKTFLEIPKLLSDSSDNKDKEIIGNLEIKNSKKSIEFEPIDKGVFVKDTGHTNSILGKEYSLQIEKDEDTNMIVSVRPVIPIIMNQDKFKTYTVHSERNGVELLDNCKVLAESEDKASDYVIFACRKEELIKRNDTIKTDIFLNGKQVSGFICRV